MKDYYDRIVFYACLLVIALGSFAGGFITAICIIITIWRWIV